MLCFCQKGLTCGEGISSFPVLLFYVQTLWLGYDFFSISQNLMKFIEKTHELVMSLIVFLRSWAIVLGQREFYFADCLKVVRHTSKFAI